jgi:hypothetical protein
VLLSSWVGQHRCAGVVNALCRYFIPFVLSAIFALGDSVWESQPPAVLQSASFFPDERDRDAAQGSMYPSGFIPCSKLRDVSVLFAQT